MRRLLLVLAVTMVTGLAAQAPAHDPFLDQLVGTWSGGGTIAGDPVGYSVQARWTLGDQFLLLDLSDTARPPQYMAQVYIGYDSISERYVMHWLDNMGARFSGTLGYGTRTDTTIAFRFEYPEGPFINTFSTDPAARTWTMRSTTKNSKGDWVMFGDLRLRKR